MAVAGTHDEALLCEPEKVVVLAGPRVLDESARAQLENERLARTAKALGKDFWGF